MQTRDSFFWYILVRPLGHFSARLGSLVHNDGRFPPHAQADADADAYDKDNRKHNNEDQCYANDCADRLSGQG